MHEEKDEDEGEWSWWWACPWYDGDSSPITLALSLMSFYEKYPFSLSLQAQHICAFLHHQTIISSSVSDPLNFDADPDPLPG